MAFDPNTSPVRQTKDWTAAAAATAWMLGSIGRPATEDEVATLLGPERISPELGLLDGSLAGIAAMLEEQGLRAGNAHVSFDEVSERAGRQPITLLGRAWNHLTGVRGRDEGALLLANPSSSGWMGVGERMTRADFERLG